MRVFRKLAAGLLAGSASVGIFAQETVHPVHSAQAESGSSSEPQAASSKSTGDTTPAQQESVQPESGEEPAKPEFEIRDAQGNPLPPEVQRQLREQYKDAFPPTTTDSSQSGVEASLRAVGAEIVVTGDRLRGTVKSEVPPERTLQQLEIRAYGANDIQELLQALDPQVRSDRGSEDGGPVVLLNGRRISSLAEIAKIPTEAIERIEVFPEEVALAYGYPASQKVVNVVLLARYKSTIAQLTYSAPTDGGRDTPGASVSYLRIAGNTRLNVDGEYERSGALLESERDLAQPFGSPELGRFRTLLPKTERVAINATVSGEIIQNVSTTLNGSFEASSSASLLGLGSDGVLKGESDRHVAHIGTTIAGQLATWQWTFTGNYDRASVETEVGTEDAIGFRNEARSIDASSSGDLVFNGKLLDISAGPVSTSVRVGVDLRDFSSRSLLGGIEQRRELSRNRSTVQASIDVPIASEVTGSMDWLGTFSVNLNAELERLSDFGSLRTFGYGFTWSPVPKVDVIASVTHEEGAPTMQQLGGPVVVTPNFRTFDFSQLDTVEVTRTFGGNPDLRSDDRRLINIGLTAQPFAGVDFTISADYLNSRTDNPISAFPILTAELEAAFPDRFTRDSDNRLLRIDARPLNFERSEQEQLRFGLNFTRPLGAVPQELRDVRVRFVQSESDIQRRVPTGGTLTRVAPGSPEARRVDNLTSRLYVDVYYTLRLRDEILLREQTASLDLLNGSAIDLTGGRSRHEVEFQAGASKRGLGVRVSATWRSGSTISGLNSPADDLRFSDYGTVNINLFANLADQFGGPDAPKWLKGTRLNIGIVNLFNSRPEVRDGTDRVPNIYQSAYLNPIGRVVSIGLRKSF